MSSNLILGAILSLQREEKNFTREEIIQRCKPSIVKILTYLASSYTVEGVSGVEDVFSTESGKLFGQQIDQVLEFSRKGLILTSLPALGEYTQDVLNAMAIGALSKTVEKLEKKPSPIDMQFLHDAESLVSRMDITETIEGFRELPTSEDRAWYFSFTILAIFAYLDEYSRSLTEMIEQNPIFSTYSKLSTEEMKGFSVKRRFTTIFDELSIRSIVSRFVDTKTIDHFQNGFSNFIRIRGKIAHSNPRLNHNEYSFSELESDVEEIEFDYNEVDELIEKIGFAQYGISKVKEASEEIAEVVKKVRMVVLMASIYPALIDVVLSNMIHT